MIYTFLGVLLGIFAHYYFWRETKDRFIESDPMPKIVEKSALAKKYEAIIPGIDRALTTEEAQKLIRQYRFVSY